MSVIFKQLNHKSIRAIYFIRSKCN